MGKRWKLIRAMLKNEGYTTTDSTEGISIQSIDPDGLITWTDAEGTTHESYYGGESVATTITISNVPTTMTSGSTQTLIATNDMGDVITDEVTFTSNNTSYITVSGAVLTGLGSGSTTITATVDDVSSTTESIRVLAYDIEATITVGDRGIGKVGWVKDASFPPVTHGSISPTSAADLLERLICSDNYDGTYTFELGSNVPATLSNPVVIDGVEYNMNISGGTGAYWTKVIGENPLGAIGNTVAIKINITAS